MRDSKLPKRQYTDEFKVEATRLAESVGGREAARRLGVPVATLRNWKRRSAAAGTGVPEVALNAGAVPTRRPVRVGGREQPAAPGACRCKAGRGNSSKSDGVLCQGVAMKYAWIENHRDEYTVSRLCRVLLVSRSGYCQWRVRPPSPRALSNGVLDVKVAAIHRDSRKSYGRPRITQQLRQQGECVSAERVRQSLQRQGLRPVYRRAHVATTDSAHRLPVAANILDRRFDGWQPNQALDSYIRWYNEKRIKMSLGARSPLDYRRSLGLMA